jgi:hypothetical protein
VVRVEPDNLMARAEPLADILGILDDLITLLESDPPDVGWSAWDSPEAMLTDLRRLADRVRRGDYSALTDLYVMFLPTGQLGEVEISSGWSQHYLDLAARFDQAYMQFKAQARRDS